MFDEGADGGVGGVGDDAIISIRVLKCMHSTVHGLSRVACVVTPALMSRILKEQNERNAGSIGLRR